MSIYIKGMKMPTSCDDCWALDDYGDYPRCRITEEQRGYNFPIREKRMDRCPLIDDAVPEIHAHWINVSPYDRHYGRCSRCHGTPVWKSLYCPSCGAKMDEVVR